MTLPTEIPLSLYIHLPWCIQKCPYCDFNSYGIARHPLKEADYVEALDKNLKDYLPWIGDRKFKSIFFGGGTPSLFSASSIETILKNVHQHNLFDFGKAEITLEANPGTFEYQKFSDYKQAGINRISVGVQSFNDAHLKVLGRVHHALEAQKACEALLQLEFNFNIDIMYGLPHQSIEDALNDLKTAVSFSPNHLSWYHLTLEPNTVFYRTPPAGLPESDAVFEIEEVGRQFLKEQGFERYEVSAYARKNFQSIHNLNYWTFGDYVGIGAGAHGKLTDQKSGKIWRTTEPRIPINYLKAIAPHVRQWQEIEPQNRTLEYLLNQLRLFYCHWDKFEIATGMSREILYPVFQKAKEQELVEFTEIGIRLTERGKLFLNEILQFL